MTRLLTSTIAAVVTFMVATAPAPAACPNERLRVENNSTALPECRAYEQVTPNDKNSQHFVRGGNTAPDGEAILFSALSELPGNPTGGSSADVSRRTATGWQTQALAPGNDNPTNQEPVALGATGGNYGTIFLGDDSDLTAGDEDTFIKDVFATTEDNLFSWISQGPNGGVGAAPAQEPELHDTVGGASPSLDHVVFESPFGTLLSSDTHTSGSEIYDRIDESSTELVGIMPNNEVPPCGAELGDQQGSESGDFGSVSESGAIVFFTSPFRETACASFTPRQLYARAGTETVTVSAPETGVVDPNGQQEASYRAATPDGTDVVFTSKGALTSDANTSNDTNEDLYEYQVTERKLTDLSSAGIADPYGSQVQGLLGTSQDGKVVYFVAQGKLTSQATEGADNLYVSAHEGLSYVAQLSASDAQDWTGLTQGHTSQITPDGNHLLFADSESLTGYGNAGRSELYLYSLPERTITCVSCGPPGTTATGRTYLGRAASQGFPPAGNLSADGTKVFFTSTEPLTSETVQREAVFEWHNGELSMIANGAGFADATPSGDDVFFDTQESLVPGDTDEGDQDIYDARVNGGFPAPSPPEKQCESSSECRTEGTLLSTPAITSNGPGAVGNLIPAAPSTETVLRIAAHSAKAISVKTLSAGTLTLSGTGVTATKKTASKAGTYSLPLTLTKAERKLLAKRASVTVTVRVKFTPTSGKSSTATTKVTIRKPNPKTRSKKK